MVVQDLILRKAICQQCTVKGVDVMDDFVITIPRNIVLSSSWSKIVS